MDAKGFVGRIQSLVLNMLSLGYLLDLQVGMLRRQVYL